MIDMENQELLKLIEAAIAKYPSFRKAVELLLQMPEADLKVLCGDLEELKDG